MIFEILCVLVTILIAGFTLQRQRMSRNFPKGPMGIPILGYLPWLLPELHINIGKLAERYGPIFSVPLGNEVYVVINEYELVKESMKMDAFAGRPNHLLALECMKYGLSFNDGRSWTEQRRFALRALKDFGFGKQSMDPMIQEAAQDLVNYYRGHVGQPIDLMKIFPAVALNCIWIMVAGEKLPLDPHSKVMVIFNLGKKGITDPATQGPLFVMPWLAKIFPEATGYNDLQRAKTGIDSLSTNIIDEHKKTMIVGSPRDYIDMFLEKMNDSENDPESSFYKEMGVVNLIDSMVSFFMAEGDTMTSIMGFTILYLLKSPHVLTKIQEEIDRVIGNSRIPSASDRQLMPYTEAVMHECLRLASILPGAILHSTMQNVEFHGYHLPKGTIVYANLYQVNHDVKYWGDPKAFRPERFINSDGSFRKDERVVSFGIGKRECLAADPSSPLPPNEVRSAFVLSSEPYKVILTERK